MKKLNKNQKLILLGLTLFGAYQLNHYLKQQKKLKKSQEEHLNRIAEYKANPKPPGYNAPIDYEAHERRLQELFRKARN